MLRLILVFVLLAGCTAATAPAPCGHNYAAAPGATTHVELTAGCTDTIFVGFTPGPTP